MSNPKQPTKHHFFKTFLAADWQNDDTVDCTSRNPTVTILIDWEICELFSRHLFLKWWCDHWGLRFTLKVLIQWALGPDGATYQPFSCYMNTCACETSGQESSIPFPLPPPPPSCPRSLHPPSKLWTPSQQPSRQAERWNAEPTLRLVTGSAPAPVLKWMNSCCGHSKHVMTDCAIRTSILLPI